MTYRSCLLGAAACAAFSTAAHAQLVPGGGSTLASPTYLLQFSVFENNDPNTSFSSEYVPSGSGAAQDAFIGNKPVNPNVASTVDFAASDATLTAARLSTWQSGATGQSVGGNLIEVPTFGVPITVPFNFSGVASNSAVNLTDAQLCGVFSGKITNTNGLPGTGLPANQPITVVYRGDGSGTSFLFTQHLAAVCGPVSGGLTNVAFSAQQTFASEFPNSVVPSNFVAGTGSPGVQAAIDGTASSIGYLSPDYTHIIAGPTTDSNGKAPYVAAVNGISPTSANTLTALSSAPTPSIDPTQPNTAIPVVAKPTSGYPIVGYTTWLFAQCYADPTVGNAIQSFILGDYRQNILKTAVTTSGFSNLPTPVFSAVSQAYFSGGANSVGGSGCAGHSGR